MFSDLREKDRNSLYSPSEFWGQAWPEKHIQLLKEHGFHRFKRTVNFEYHQWGVTSLLNEQFQPCIEKCLSQEGVALHCSSCKQQDATAGDTKAKFRQLRL